jgi:sporulation protein YlmC with PRC-barrel domain
MTQIFRKTLLAGAIAALLATPVFAADEATRDGVEAPDVPQAGQQWRDETTTGRTMTGESTDQPESSSQAQPEGPDAQEDASSGLEELEEPVGYATEEYTKDGDRALYSRSFNDLDGMDVVDSAGERIGKLTGVVLSTDRQSAHAVISSGGFLGMGTRETLVSFSELELLDDQLQLNATEEAFKARSEFQADDYIELGGDRPIGESIVEASPSETGDGSDPRGDTLPRGTGESEGGTTTPAETTESN